MTPKTIVEDLNEGAEETFKVVARIALEDTPQLLKALNLRVIS